MDEKYLGKKILQAREKSGLSQEDVENALKMPKKSMAKIEAGQRKVSSLELMKLAELFRVSIAQFFTQQKADDLLVALYRAVPGVERNSAIQKEVAKCLQLCQEGIVLENLLKISFRRQVCFYAPHATCNIHEAISQGEQAARDERRRLGLGNLPIPNMTELLSSLGIWNAATSLPDEVSGLFMHHPSISMVILVNNNHSIMRQRFSYAHEYAHALFDQDRQVLVSSASNDTELIEARANAFAAAFLMPSDGVAEIIQSLGKGHPSRSKTTIFDSSAKDITEVHERMIASSQKLTPQDIAFLSHHFKVSYQALVYRLKNLRYLSSKEQDQLLQEESKGKSYLRIVGLLNDLEQKNVHHQRELKVYISRLIIEAYRCEKISRGRLMELSKLLGLPAQQLLAMAENEA